MRFTAVGICVLLVVLISVAQPPAIEWSHTYIMDVPMSWDVIQTLDGGYIVAGTSQIYTPYLYKVNAAGNAQWVAHAFAQGPAQGHSVKDVIQNPDSTYVVIGTNYSNPYGARNWYCSKVSTTGATIWGSIVSGGIVYGDPWCVARNADGGYVIAGENAPDLMCLSSGGANLYERYYDGNLYSAVPHADGTYTGGGTIISPTTAEDFYLVHTDNLGQVAWQRTYARPGRQICYWMDPTSDGGFIMAGYDSVAADGSTDLYIIRANSVGDTLWTRLINTASFEYAYDVHQTQDGGFILLSFVGALSTLTKLNTSGDPQWSLTMNAYAMSPTSDGGYIVAGMNTTHLILTKFAPDISSPSPPQALTIDVVGDNMTLHWNRVSNATSYVVYSALTSDGVYAIDGTGVFADTAWTAPVSDVLKYFYVTAVQQ